jgi:hypothetical protein
MELHSKKCYIGPNMHYPATVFQVSSSTPLYCCDHLPFDTQTNILLIYIVFQINIKHEGVIEELVQNMLFVKIFNHFGYCFGIFFDMFEKCSAIPLWNSYKLYEQDNQNCDEAITFYLFVYLFLSISFYERVRWWV